uniref:RNA-directed DNA polymerase n=1 Tax=Romanomermis culicivorax TaxID=13658 RepID=A0A915HUV0_ROMCU
MNVQWHSNKLKLLLHKFDPWHAQLAEFDYDIQHKPGSDNVIPNMLSRLPQPPPMKDDLLYLVIKLGNQCGWKANHRQDGYLTPYYIVRNNLAVDQGLLLKAYRIVAPSKLCRQLINKGHEGHPGIVRAKIKLCETYWWPSIAADIEERIRHCQGCQDSAKSNPRSRIPTDPLPLLKAPWEKIVIDFTGPFSMAPYQNRFAILVIDYLSSFPKVGLCPNHTAERTIEFLTELFTCYGNLAVLVSDNRPIYGSDAFTEFLSKRNIQHHATPVYHPQSNGKVEVFNPSLKFHAQAMATSNTPFAAAITELLARFRVERPYPETLSPAEIMFNQCARLPFEPCQSISEPAAPQLKKARQNVRFEEKHGPK